MQENYASEKLKRQQPLPVCQFDKRIEFPTFHFISVLRKPRKLQYHYDDW